MAKLHIKKGDNVMVISGDNKGLSGQVVSVSPKLMKAVVEGLNMVKKHQKPTQQVAGAIIEKEAPIHVSNLMVIDPKTNKPTRTARTKTATGKTVRVAKKSGEIIG